jgi:hypothetical protein
MKKTMGTPQRYSEILVAIASATFGLLIQPIMKSVTSPLFDTPTKAVLSGFVLLALIVIIAIITVSILVRNHNKQLDRFETNLSETKTQIKLSTSLEEMGISVASNNYPEAIIISDFWTKSEREIRILQTYIGSVQQLPKSIFAAVKRGVKFKLLLLNPDSETIRQRLRDIGLPDTIQVHQDAMERLKILIRRNNPDPELFEVRLYNGLPPFSLYNADAKLCIGFFWHGEHSPSGPHIFIDDSNSTLGKFLMNTFDNIWQNSEDARILDQ